MKLNRDKDMDRWDQPFHWVGHHDGGDDSFEAQHLIKNRYDIEILGGIEDKDASYSYDEWALCKLDGAFYLLSTSGCSCPSPSETWRVEIGPSTLSEIRAHVQGGHYEGYTVPKKQMNEFMELLDEAEKKEQSK